MEKIYETAYYGAGAAKITRILTEEKVPTPSWLNYQRYGNFANIYKNAPESKKYAWTIAQVKSILKDETYIGNTIHYRETNISYKNKKRIRKPQSEWMRVEGTQEAIISKEDFERVQQQIASRRRKQKNATTQIFAGLVRCADCGWSMKFATNGKTKYGIVTSVAPVIHSTVRADTLNPTFAVICCMFICWHGYSIGWNRRNWIEDSGYASCRKTSGVSRQQR